MITNSHQSHKMYIIAKPITYVACYFVEFFSNCVTLALLEKCLKAPVAGALWYRFFEPVPRKWYQRLEPLVPNKVTGT